MDNESQGSKQNGQIDILGANSAGEKYSPFKPPNEE